MKSDAFFFLAIIGFFFVLWYASGGPTKPISFAGPYITPISDVDDVSEGYGDTPTGGSFWGDVINVESTIAGLQRQTTEIRGFGETSPYHGKVSISGGGTGATDPDQEYFSIYVTGTEAIDITGWQVVSGASSKSERIPEGTTLPRTGRVNDTDPIVLQPGDEAVIITGESPIGVSFRENMCSGYLAKNQTFYPSLRSSCPSPLDEFDRYYRGNELRDDKCYTLMQNTPVCSVPRERGNVSSSCYALIDDVLNYNGCVATHGEESQFSSRVWRVYLEHEDRDRDPEEMWKSSRDAIKLLDANGKTVDLYSY